MKTPYLYLCSRVRASARPLNEQVANALKTAGYDVFIPHLQVYNNESGATDEEIYTQDMAAMLKADACVVVSDIGVDCAFEIGHFQARQIPVLWFQPPKDDRHPMMFKILSAHSHENTYSLISDLERLLRRRPFPINLWSAYS